MASNFKIPFFKSKRDGLAIDLCLDAKVAASGAKKAAEATGVLLWDRSKIKELINNISKE